MKHVIAAMTLLLLSVAAVPAVAGSPWVSGYYPGWSQETLPPAKIRMDALTHLFHFACGIKPDGTLDTAAFRMTDAHIKATVAAARAGNRKVVIVLGGADSGPGFHGATSPANRAAFIGRVIEFVKRHGYDGVDIDWEPLSRADNEQFRTFVIELRAALRKSDPRSLLSAATGPSWDNPGVQKLFAGLADHFDQINLMTYVLAGSWEGWMTWHGSALSSGGPKFSNGREMPSIENCMASFTAASVRAEKLGIGLGFHGSIWSGGEGTDTGGATRPGQAWTKPPDVKSDIAYVDLMKEYFAADRFHFDAVTQSPYLSIDQPGSKDDRFISYTDARAVTARLKFMESKHFGGCIIWHIAEDTMPNGDQPLTKAVAEFLKTGGR